MEGWKGEERKGGGRRMEEARDKESQSHGTVSEQREERGMKEGGCDAE